MTAGKSASSHHGIVSQGTDVPNIVDTHQSGRSTLMVYSSAQIEPHMFEDLRFYFLMVFPLSVIFLNDRMEIFPIVRGPISSLAIQFHLLLVIIFSRLQVSEVELFLKIFFLPKYVRIGTWTNHLAPAAARLPVRRCPYLHGRSIHRVFPGLTVFIPPIPDAVDQILKLGIGRFHFHEGDNYPGHER